MAERFGVAEDRGELRRALLGVGVRIEVACANVIGPASLAIEATTARLRPRRFCDKPNLSRTAGTSALIARTNGARDRIALYVGASELGLVAKRGDQAIEMRAALDVPCDG